MGIVDILIIVACVLIVAGTVTLSIVNKKKGKSSCGCDCASCKGCSACKTDKNK